MKRVVLYKNGVGYFEHVGTVRDNQNVTIAFTSGQLNDVLKSLTALDLNGGRITGVAYGSSAPADRQLGDLRLPVAEDASLTDFLNALRGARLEVRNGPTVIAGRLLSVERKTRAGSGVTLEVDYVSILTDSGEVKTTEVSPQFSVRLLDRELAGKMNRFLDLVSAGREPDVRRMVISAEGTGERSMFVSYISEVPIWKSTYRVVLGPKSGQSPLIQGWAIVDNTVGQDWENVRLSLVAGAPQSFIQNLSQPYYSRRPVVGMPESANPAPQTYQATLIPGGPRLFGTVRDPTGAVVPNVNVRLFDSTGGLVAEGVSDRAGRYELPFPASGPARMEVQAQGFKNSVVSGIARAGRQDVQLSIGTVSETVAVHADTMTVQTSTSGMGRPRSSNLGTGAAMGMGIAGRTDRFERLQQYAALKPSVARAASESAALAQELGDLFEYKLKEPVTIQKNRSALVPIVQSPVGAEKVSVWNESAGLARPVRALWLNNSTGVTLDGGSFSVLEEETFAGEGIFEPIRPGEKRLMSYAVDLALNASSKTGSEATRITRVRISRGVLTHENDIREKKTYTFRNEDSLPRTVIVEHPVRPGYELRSEPKPVETTAGWMRFRLIVDPKQTAALEIEEARSAEITYEISSLNTDHVALFVRQKSIDPAIEEALRGILGEKQVIAGLENRKEAFETEIASIYNDQQRLRENLKSLKNSLEEKALVQRYTSQLNEQETRLDTLKKQLESVTEQIEKAEKGLEQRIERLSFDVRLP